MYPRSLVSASTCLLSTICFSIPCSAQEFLKPVVSQPPSFEITATETSSGVSADIGFGSNNVFGSPGLPNISNLPLSSSFSNPVSVSMARSASVSPYIHSNQASRGPSLSTTSTGLNAPNSVDSSAIPSGQWSYGFSQAPPASTIDFDPNSGAVDFNVNLASLIPGQNASGAYGGQQLPVVSTSSVDIKTVDCPFLRLGRGTVGLGSDTPGAGGNVQTTSGIGVAYGTNGINMQLNPGDVSISALQSYFGN